MPRPSTRSIAAALLCASLAAGGWLRFSRLDARSVTHPEMYVPGIPLPEGISEPAERKTVARVLTGTFSSDTHPPGYYLFMMPWTRSMGTSLAAMRFPSALLGTASIVLVFAVGALAGVPVSGAIAAALLALNGHHIFWSQVARMFALACFLGLASSVMMMRIAQGSRFRRILLAGYVAVVLAGVATHVFFWSLLATQILWAFANNWGKRELGDLCRAQLFALILGSPFLAFAAYQSGTTVAQLSGNVFVFLADFLPFAFALPSARSGFFPGAIPYSGSLLFDGARAVILLISAVLLVKGVRSLWHPADAGRVKERPSHRGFWMLAWTAAAVVATGEIAGFVYMTHRLPPTLIHDTIGLTKLFSVLPAMFLAMAVLADRRWSALPAPGGWKRWLEGERALIVMQAAVPFLLLSGASQARPLLNQRGLLFAAPYLLLVLAAGLNSVKKVWLVAALPVLALVCAASVQSYRGITVDPTDYAQFANAITAEIRSDDLVFIRKLWSETPILYYLPAARYQLAGRDFRAECVRHPRARVWVVLINNLDATPDMEKALTGYRAVRTVTGAHARATLYEPPAGALVSQTFEN